MKTIGRVLVILIVFSIVTGLIVTAVNLSGMNVPNIDGVPQFRPNESEDRPGLNSAENLPERRERDSGIPRWLFGVIKNVIVIGFLVTVIVWPRSLARRKKKVGVVQTSIDEE